LDEGDHIKSGKKTAIYKAVMQLVRDYGIVATGNCITFFAIYIIL